MLHRTMSALSGALVALVAQAAAIAAPAVAHVETRGSGSIPLVLVPGFACDWTVWDEFMTRNADRYTMHAVTLAGFAGTPALPRADGPTPWLDGAVEGVAQVITDRGLRDPVVIGHSMGGIIALRLGIEKPELVGGVVSIDGMPTYSLGAPVPPEQRAGIVETEIAPNARATTEEKWRADHAHAVERWVTDPSRAAELHALVGRTPKDVGIEYYIEILKTDLTPGLAKLQDPTLVIAAIIDPSDAPGVQVESIRQTWRDAMANAPRARLVFFDATRHFVMDEKPAELDSAIAEFLASARTSAPGAGK